jgi:hypothetical protein
MGAFRDSVVNNVESNSYHRLCVFGKTIASITDERDRELLIALLERPTIEVGHKWLIDRMAEAGIKPPKMMTLRRHRSHECGCYYPMDALVGPEVDDG